MIKFRSTPLVELLNEDTINRLFDELEIETHQCHCNSYRFADWLENNGYDVMFVPCCLIDDNGVVCPEFEHNVVKVGDNYFDITFEYNLRTSDFFEDENRNEYCVCGMLTPFEYWNICKDFEMWFTPFAHQLVDGKYIRYEDIEEVVVEPEEYEEDYKNMIDFITNYIG